MAKKDSNPETAVILKLLPQWIDMYMNGRTTTYIAKRYGSTSSTVRRRLMQSGVAIRSKSQVKMNSLNPMWKGNGVGYIALHAWVKRRLPKPYLCSTCNSRKAIDLANISQEYLRRVDDWEWLCRKCHMTKDGRIMNLKQYVH